VVALDNVNYRVYRNKVNVLIDENGAGKSTMIKILARDETPSSGTINPYGNVVPLHYTPESNKHGLTIILKQLEF
ncbi:ATP-binding cassette domain-containing protein, partial [Escherichia coli]|uniref:ATP-binding cassette domain-containing protein n=1 Tax=Escherichia coli TaxID=562 RepID=UPI0010CB7382